MSFLRFKMLLILDESGIRCPEDCLPVRRIPPLGTSLGFVVCGFRRSSCAPDAPQFVHLAGAKALAEDVSTRVAD